MKHTVLIAGLGNIFLGDDGFGVEVVTRLASLDLPAWVRVADFGIRGMHLLYDILDQDYETIILVDATARGGAPGTLYLIETAANANTETVHNLPDAHTMTPDIVLGFLRSTGHRFEHVLLVGCEPFSTDEDIGLSETVTSAVDEAITFILHLLQGLAQGGADGRRTYTLH